MAENLPDGNDAGATGANSQTPQNQPSGPAADENQQQPTLTFDSLSEEQRNYLKGQGITGEGALTQDALTKVVDHARSSQQTLAERQAELEKLRNGGGANPTGPTGVNSEGASGAQSSTQQPEHKGLDETNAFVLAGTLSSQYPKLAEKLADGTFYEEMEKEGYAVAKPDGTPNLANIQKYAQRATKELELEEKLAEANKPNQIPDADGNNTPAFDASTQMTAEIARAIIVTDPQNPRVAEAQKFLQDNVGRK